MKTAIVTPAAPEAIGPYSQGIDAGAFVFASGQIPIDPATGALVEGGIEAQARQALKNLAAVLSAAGCSLANVVKTTVFLQNIGDFALVNELYAQAFEGFGAYPARSAVEVGALPKGALVEIEAIAAK